MVWGGVACWGVWGARVVVVGCCCGVVVGGREVLFAGAVEGWASVAGEAIVAFRVVMLLCYGIDGVAMV